MGRSIVIPEEHVGMVYEVPGPNGIKPRLKPQSWQGTHGLNDAQKAEFYYNEALGKLALARYWMEKSASD